MPPKVLIYAVALLKTLLFSIPKDMAFSVLGIVDKSPARIVPIMISRIVYNTRMCEKFNFICNYLIHSSSKIAYTTSSVHSSLNQILFLKCASSLMPILLSRAIDFVFFGSTEAVILCFFKLLNR